MHYVILSFLFAFYPSDIDTTIINGIIKNTSGQTYKKISSPVAPSVKTQKTQRVRMDNSRKYWSVIPWTHESPLTGGKNQKECPKKTILRNWWNDPRVQHGYNISCWDMDFIRTIEAESRWDINSVWDNGNSYGLCQINKRFNPVMQDEYRWLSTDNQKVEYCYNQYSLWKKRWVLHKRLYWYNVRNLPRNKNVFTFLK